MFRDWTTKITVLPAEAGIFLYVTTLEFIRSSNGSGIFMHWGKATEARN
jgi:hypothetical protein